MINNKDQVKTFFSGTLYVYSDCTVTVMYMKTRYKMSLLHLHE